MLALNLNGSQNEIDHMVFILIWQNKTLGLSLYVITNNSPLLGGMDFPPLDQDCISAYLNGKV